MRHHLVIAAALAGAAAGPVWAQSAEETAARLEARMNAAPDPSLPPVESLTCDRMLAELTAAGDLMSSQLDPSFAANADAAMAAAQDAMRPNAGAIAQGVGVVAACQSPVPGACMAAQQAQRAVAAQQGAEHQAQMAEMIAQVEASTAGVDLARMMALSERFESENCPTPE